MSRSSDLSRLGRSSYSELYERHQHGLLAFFMRRTFDPEASERAALERLGVLDATLADGRALHHAGPQRLNAARSERRR